MKIILINPPRTNMIRTILPKGIETGRGFSPPLGLLYVAAAVKKLIPDLELKVIDADALGLNADGLKPLLQKENPDIIGVTAMTFTLIDAIKTAQVAQETGAKVVLGGSHAHIYPKETLTSSGADAVFTGEGETSFPTYVKATLENKDVSGIPGIWINTTDGPKGSNPPDFISDLDGLPFPLREALDANLYSSVLFSREPTTTMITSRGCPIKCTFCMRPHMGKKFRARSPKNVIDEMLECVEMGVRDFLIYDDTFTLVRERVEEICELIIESKLATGSRDDIAWDVRARVTDVDEKLLRLMRRAGCEKIHFGVESGDPEILEAYRKEITASDAKKAFRLARNAGMETLAYFMFGAPGETIATAERSVSLAKELKPDYVHFSLLMPFPATEIYYQGLDKGVFKTDVWREFAANPTPGFEPPVWEENLTREELIDIMNRAYRSFYFAPSYILSRLKKIRSFKDFRRKARVAMGMIS